MSQFHSAYLHWRDAQRTLDDLDKVFVVGCAKSGTTWLRNILNGHDQIVITGEGGFAWRLFPAVAQGVETFNQHQREHAHARITHLRDFETLVATRTLIDAQLIRYIAESGKDPSRIRCVGDKTPQHATGIPLLNQLYPEARFIHIVRDPRDVAVSAWFHLGASEKARSIEEYARYFITQVWPANVRAASEAGASVGDRYLEIRYEDLHENEPEHVLRCLDFLGVDASEAAVRRCMDAGSFESRSGGRARGEARNDAFYRKGVTGDWINHLAPDFAVRCVEPVAPLMARFGYDLAVTA